MSTVLDFEPSEVKLSRREMLQGQGVPDNANLTGNFERIFDEAERLLVELVRPIGIVMDVDIPTFARVLQGEGLNEPRNPVDDIYRGSCSLSLFAVTLGSGLSGRVSQLFDRGDYALGYMLDSISSVAAEKLSEAVSLRMAESLEGIEEQAHVQKVLPYSPGYCGWHISGQRKLFEVLRPEEVGITLNESCLMTPIKSISGVLIGGTTELHEFQSLYPFCAACTVRSCAGRMGKPELDGTQSSEG